MAECAQPACSLMSLMSEAKVLIISALQYKHQTGYGAPAVQLAVVVAAERRRNALFRTGYKARAHSLGSC